MLSYKEFNNNKKSYQESMAGQDEWLNAAIDAANQALKGLMAVKPFVRDEAESYVAVMKAAAAIQGYLGKIAPHHSSLPLH